MKTTSNIPIPTTPLRWKEGEWFIAVNHKDNGVQPAEEEGRRYEADFTIVKELTAEAAILAFTRQQQNSTLDRQVIENIEVSGVKAIDIVEEYATKVATTIFPPLPSSGFLEVGRIFSYNNGAVMVRQSHERTIYTPEETPALFSFYRDNASAELAWMEGEKVEAGWKRTFNGKTYECLQAHQTQVGWEPTNASALWKEVQGEEIPVWVQPTGAHDAYNIGARVHYPTITDPIYESLINGNVWSPVAYPSGWRLV
jgi:hypothetical protein